MAERNCCCRTSIPRGSGGPGVDGSMGGGVLRTALHARATPVRPVFVGRGESRAVEAAGAFEAKVFRTARLSALRAACRRIRDAPHAGWAAATPARGVP